MRKVIISVFLILLVVLFTSCSNSLQDAVEENNARLAGFMNCYRTVKGYNHTVLKAAEGTWDLSNLDDEETKLVVEYIVYSLYDKFDYLISAKGTFSNVTESTSDGTTYNFTFSGVEIKYILNKGEEERTLTVDGELSISYWGEIYIAGVSKSNYITYDSPYFKENGVEYKSMSAEIYFINYLYDYGPVVYTFESTTYDGEKVDHEFLNKLNFVTI